MSFTYGTTDIPTTIFVEALYLSNAEKKEYSYTGQFVRQLLIYLKYYFIKPAFLLLFILMVLLSFILRIYENENQTGTVIAYCISGQGNSETLIERCI